jgi:TRAP-type C4-dicarboxylate transport system substrate-binding protein
LKRKGLFTLLGSLCLVLVLAVLSVMVACAVEEEEEAPTTEPIVLEAVGFWAPGHATYWGLNQFIERVEEQSNGELIIKFVGGPEAIPMFEQPEALMSGVVDIVYNPISIYAWVGVPETFVLNFTALQPWEQRQTGLYDFMNEIFMENNVYYLGLTDRLLGYYCFLVDPIEKPEDLVRLTMPADPGLSNLWEVFGVNLIDIDDAEIWSALDRGLLDGMFNPLPSVDEQSWYEVLNYRVEPPLFPVSITGITVNLDTWNGLPSHLQQLLIDIMGPLERDAVANSVAQEEEHYRKIAEAGVETINFSPADTQRYIDMATEFAWDVVLPENISPERLAEVRQLTDLK